MGRICTCGWERVIRASAEEAGRLPTLKAIAIAAITHNLHALISGDGGVLQRLPEECVADLARALPPDALMRLR